MASIDDLARLAQQTGSVLMEQVVGEEHHFIVLVESLIYPYTLREVRADQHVVS